MVLGMESAAPEVLGLHGARGCLRGTDVLLGRRKVGVHPESVLCLPVTN